MPRIANIGETIVFRDNTGRVLEGQIVRLNQTTVKVRTQKVQLKDGSMKSLWLVSRNYADRYVRGEMNAEA